MKLQDLGYTNKWIEYGFIDLEIIKIQLDEFNKGNDLNAEHYRYRTFINWLESKDAFTDIEIENYFKLASEDPDSLMAGSAVKELFISSKITNSQFELIKSKLPELGNWTKKLILRESLKRRILNEKLSKELVDQCIIYKKEFNDSLLIELIIKATNEVEFLIDFTNGDFGKRIKNLAIEKIKTCR